MLPNFGYGRQIMLTDVKKQGLPQMSANRPNIGSTGIEGTNRVRNDPSRNRRTDEVPFIAGCSHFTRKNARLRAPASSPKQSPCNIHAAITLAVLLCSAKSHTTLHQGQFFPDVWLCSVKSHTTLHQSQFFADVLLCSAKSHTTLHQSQFFADVIVM